MRLISTLGALGHCAIWKYFNQKWMEGVFDSIGNISGRLFTLQVLYPYIFALDAQCNTTHDSYAIYLSYNNEK